CRGRVAARAGGPGPPPASRQEPAKQHACCKARRGNRGSEAPQSSCRGASRRALTRDDASRSIEGGHTRKFGNCCSLQSALLETRADVAPCRGEPTDCLLPLGRTGRYKEKP